MNPKPTKILIGLFLLFILGSFPIELSAQSNQTAPSLGDQEKLPPPNILWLTAEDIGPHLGCYGDQVAKTPNLDKLASKGMIYKTAWSNYPVCAPARTTIITGLYASSMAAGHMRCRVPLPKKIKMFPEYLRKAGYFCTNQSKEDFNLTKNVKVWDRLGRKATYRKDKTSPFFSVFNYTGTHESQIRNKKGKPKTDLDSIIVPPYYPDNATVRTDWAHYYDNISKLDRWVGKKLSELEKNGQAENTIVFFFGDHGSGMPRHKRFAGDSGMRVPMIVFVPPKYRQWAGRSFQPGTTSNQLVGFVDLAPTVLRLANLEVPSEIQGKSFLRIGKEIRQKNYLYGFRSRMDETIDCSRSITDGRFVYIRNYMPFVPHGQYISYQQQTPTTAIWNRKARKGELNPVQSQFWNPKSPEELYDLEADPHETKNLASDPTYKKELQRFRAELLDAMTKRFLDVEMFPEFWTINRKAQTHLYDYARTSGGKKYLRECIVHAESASGESQITVDDAFDKLSLMSIHHASSFWIGMSLLNRKEKWKPKQLQKLEDYLIHPLPIVRVQVAEILLKNGTLGQKEKSVNVLIHEANKPGENYEVAVWAMNVMNRHFKTIRSLKVPVRFSNYLDKKARGKGYWKRLIDRWNNRIPKSIKNKIIGQSWKRHSIGAPFSGADGVRIADMNDDGRPDVITGFEEGGRTVIFFNPSSKNIRQPWKFQEAGIARDVEDAFPIDIDQDGKMEVVSLSEGRTQKIFFHQLAGKSQKNTKSKHWQTNSLPNAEGRMKWMYGIPLQVDEKNGRDIVAGGKGKNAQIGWFRSPALPNKLDHWKWYPISVASWVMSIRARDMDFDGDQDVVLSDRKSGKYQGCRWLENPGPGQHQHLEWKNHKIGSSGKEVGFLDIADLDQDELEDVLVANMANHSIDIHKRLDRTGKFWKSHSIPLPSLVGRPKAVRAGDIDGDGSLDIVYSSNTLHKGGKVGIVWVSSKQKNWKGDLQWHHVSGPEGYKFDRLELVDLDNDGDLDILTTEENFGKDSKGLGVVWYENPVRS